MVILRTRNKITDFLMILAWASPFKPNIMLCLLSGPTATPEIHVDEDQRLKKT